MERFDNQAETAMKLKKKAQTTTFIIIGISLIIGTTIMIFYINSQKKGDAKTFPKDILNNIERQATKCLEKTAENAIELLTSQGGFIYTDQGGLTESNNYINFEGKRIAKLVEIPDFSDDNLKMSTTPPNYPWQKFPITNNGKRYQSNIVFGVNKIPPLENEYDNYKSWNATLESYVSKKIINCIDTEQLKEHGIKIENAQPIVSVTIAENDVVFRSSGMRIILPEGATAEINSIRARIPINLRKMHSTATKIIDREVYDIKNKLTANQELPVYTQKNDGLTIVSITDGKTIFNFAIPNRRPALEYIQQPEQVLCENTVISFENNQIKISSPENCAQNIQIVSPITLTALEPDEDSLHYSVVPEIPANTQLPLTITPEIKILDCIRLKAIVSDNYGLEDYQIINFKLKEDVQC